MRRAASTALLAAFGAAALSPGLVHAARFQHDALCATDYPIVLVLDETDERTHADKQNLLGAIGHLATAGVPGQVVDVWLLRGDVSDTQRVQRTCRPSPCPRSLREWKRALELNSACMESEVARLEADFALALRNATRSFHSEQSEYSHSPIAAAIAVIARQYAEEGGRPLVTIFGDGNENGVYSPYGPDSKACICSHATWPAIRSNLESLGYLADLSHVRIAFAATGRPIGKESRARGDYLDAATNRRHREFWHWLIESSHGELIGYGASFDPTWLASSAPLLAPLVAGESVAAKARPYRVGSRKEGAR